MPDSHVSAVPPPLTVLLDLASQQSNRELVERIRQVLLALAARVVIAADKLATYEAIDLVICDRSGALAELRLEGEPGAARAGLIALGQPAAAADAHLPLDFSDRELLLACQLVGEIVRLRRRWLDVERDRHELARLAAADPLTGLANRRAWDAEAPERLRRAQAAGQSICLAIFDVDRFKTVNDERGYATGDDVLAGIGHELASALRAGDLLARLGGDEFAALLVGSFDRAGALAIVDRVRSAVGAGETQRLGFDVSLSAGLAVALGEGSTDLAPLFAAADAALRETKRAGRNRTVSAA